MPDVNDDRAAVERALMDRFLARATREHEKPPCRLVQHAVSLALALGIVFVVLLGFDRFLTSVQKFMEIDIREPAPDPTEAMPAYVVPSAVNPPPADPDPRPSPPQAPDTAPATPR